MPKHTLRIMTLVLAAALAGCASARFPLCPKLAALSYPEPRTEAVVNSYLIERASERSVKVSPVSAFSAMLSGSPYSLSWFQKNYSFMLCSFNPKQMIEDESVYLVCMSHAQSWIDIVRSKTPENLMLKETHYADVCVK